MSQSPEASGDEPVSSVSLSLLVEDVVKGRGDGCVLIGKLQGEGVVRVGDSALGDGQRLEIRAIERFRESLTEVGAGDGAVGLTVASAADVSSLAGTTVQFAERPDEGVPALTPSGALVADQAVLVGWSKSRKTLSYKFAVLILDGMRVRMIDGDGQTLFDDTGEHLSASAAGGTQVALQAPDGSIRYLVGPLPKWARRGEGARLVASHGANVLPTFNVDHHEGALAKMMVTPATSNLRIHKLWQTALVEMLSTRGVRELA